MPELARKIVLWLIFQLTRRSKILRCVWTRPGFPKNTPNGLNKTHSLSKSLQIHEKKSPKGWRRLGVEQKATKLPVSHKKLWKFFGESVFFCIRDENDDSRETKKKSFAIWNEIKFWWFIVIFIVKCTAIPVGDNLVDFFSTIGIFRTPSRARVHSVVDNLINHKLLFFTRKEN